jgi:hypothetical protein
MIDNSNPELLYIDDILGDEDWHAVEHEDGGTLLISGVFLINSREELRLAFHGGLRFKSPDSEQSARAQVMRSFSFARSALACCDLSHFSLPSCYCLDARRRSPLSRLAPYILLFLVRIPIQTSLT